MRPWATWSSFESGPVSCMLPEVGCFSVETGKNVVFLPFSTYKGRSVPKRNSRLLRNSVFCGCLLCFSSSHSRVVWKMQLFSWLFGVKHPQWSPNRIGKSCQLCLQLSAGIMKPICTANFRDILDYPDFSPSFSPVLVGIQCLAKTNEALFG